MLEILGSLSAAAAAGMRLGIPILVLGLIYTGKAWENIPIISSINPIIILSTLIVWSLLELTFSKKLLGQRLLQNFQLVFSPLGGSLLAYMMTQYYNLSADDHLTWVLVISGGFLALIIKLVEIGWFFRLGGIPIIVVVFEDMLSALMVVLALKAPQEGGLIAIALLWIALRSAGEWRIWHLKSHEKKIGN